MPHCLEHLTIARLLPDSIVPSNLGLLFRRELHVPAVRRPRAVILRAGIRCEESIYLSVGTSIAYSFTVLDKGLFASGRDLVTKKYFNNGMITPEHWSNGTMCSTICEWKFS